MQASGPWGPRLYSVLNCVRLCQESWSHGSTWRLEAGPWGSGQPLMQERRVANRSLRGSCIFFFCHDKSAGGSRGVSKRHMYGGHKEGARQIQGFACQFNAGPGALSTLHVDHAWGDSPGESGAQGFGHSFFRGESGCKTLGRSSDLSAREDFVGRKDSAEKSFGPSAAQHPLHADNFHQVHANSIDQLATLSLTMASATLHA